MLCDWRARWEMVVVWSVRGAANTSERMVGRVNAPTRPQHTTFNVLVLQMPDGYGVYQHTLLTWVSVMKCNPTMARSTWSRFSRREITWDFPLCAYTSVRKLTRWKHWELTFPFLFLIHNHKIRKFHSEWKYNSKAKSLTRSGGHRMFPRECVYNNAGRSLLIFFYVSLSLSLSH